MSLLDKDYITYIRFESGAMRTLVRKINTGLAQEEKITEEELNRNSELLKEILFQVQSGTKELLQEEGLVRSCIDYDRLNKIRK